MKHLSMILNITEVHLNYSLSSTTFTMLNIVDDINGIVEHLTSVMLKIGKITEDSK